LNGKIKYSYQHRLHVFVQQKEHQQFQRILSDLRVTKKIEIFITKTKKKNFLFLIQDLHRDEMLYKDVWNYIVQLVDNQ
jgi:hypothetical protein